MKFTQLIKTLTAEDLNNRVAQMFGSKINLESFTAEQLSTARDKLANQLLTIELEGIVDQCIELKNIIDQCIVMFFFV